MDRTPLLGSRQRRAARGKGFRAQLFSFPRILFPPSNVLGRCAKENLVPTRLMMDEQRKLSVLKLFLRIYGALSFLIFVPLCLAIMLQNPLFDDGGLMNWTIWNGVICGGQPCYVPPMLFIIYLVWAAFLFLAARDPYRYRSFLTFTAWQT